MEFAVWRHCAGVSAPVTAGMFSRSGVGGGIGVRLLEIERDALTHQGIEQRFRGAGEDGPRHHVPNQQPWYAVTAGWSGLSTPTAHFSHQKGECSPWAKCVGVVQSGVGDLRSEFVGPVDPDAWAASLA